MRIPPSTGFHALIFLGFVTKICLYLVARNRLDAPALQIVVAAVQLSPRLGEFSEISGEGVVNQFVGAAPVSSIQRSISV